MKTTASMFTGGALFDIGAQMAGYEPIWGIEWDDKIAAVARLNGFPVHTGDVTTFDFTAMKRPDHLHASPPCPNFSVAKTGAEETPFDVAMAESVSRSIAHFRPDTFTLENVPAYVHSQSFKTIINTLHGLGYFVDWQNLNSADFGVPQTRRRLWVRASKGLLMPYPEPVKWRGWYQAIEDLIPELPDTEFAPWQMARLPKEYKDFLLAQGQRSQPKESEQPADTITANRNQNNIRAFIMESKFPGRNGKTFHKDSEQPTPTITAIDPALKAFIIPGGNANSFSVREGDEPARTVESVGRVGNVPRAFVLDGMGNNHGESVTIRDGDTPIFTQTASSERRPTRAFVGRVVKMTVKALGRFQTVPDLYQGLTVRINGNGVPCLQAKGVLETLG